MFKGFLENYKSEIVSIVNYEKGIVIATGKSYLHFVGDSDLKRINFLVGS